LVVVGTLRSSTIEGLTYRAMALRVVRHTGEYEEAAIGPGEIVDVSIAEDVIYAIRTETPDGDVGNNVLHRSDDRGASWDVITSAPDGIVGVEFQDGARGYVWTANTIHRTEDSGTIWETTRVPWTIHRGKPAPVVDSDGYLWLPIGHSINWRPDGNRVVRVSPELRIDEIIGPINWIITSIVVSQDERVIVVGHTHDATRVAFSETKGVWRLRVVHEWSEIKPKFLTAGDGELAGIFIADVPKTVVYRSTDGGTTWQTWPAPERRMEFICQTDSGGIWSIGGRDRVYYDLPRVP